MELYRTKILLLQMHAKNSGKQRPDIFLRNPRGLGRQVVIDVAVTGVDG